MLYTTFGKLSKKRNCGSAVEMLEKSLGHSAVYGRDTLIYFPEIVRVCGVEVALDALRTADGGQTPETVKVKRVFAHRCVLETPLIDGGYVVDLCVSPQLKTAVLDFDVTSFEAWQSIRIVLNAVCDEVRSSLADRSCLAFFQQHAILSTILAVEAAVEHARHLAPEAYLIAMKAQEELFVKVLGGF